MDNITQGLSDAFRLILSLDRDLLEIVLRSLQVSLCALFFACLLGFPLGTWIAIHRFRLRRLTLIFLNAMIGLPPVVVGLIVYILLSRTGPFGVLGLLFTPTAMIIAQTIIITPLVASIAYRVMDDLWEQYRDLLVSLDANLWQCICSLLRDGRRGLLTACLAGFGRAIGEVGAVMIVGGNIDHATRVLTTAIALETGRGDFALALGLGFILIFLSLLVNFTFHSVSRYESGTGW